MQFIDRIKRDAFEKSIKMNLIDFQFNDSEEEKNTFHTWKFFKNWEFEISNRINKFSHRGIIFIKRITKHPAYRIDSNVNTMNFEIWSYNTGIKSKDRI